MRRLIAVITCRKYDYAVNDNLSHKTGEDVERATIIQNTWYKLWEKQKDEIDLKFFYGGELYALSGEHEVHLEVPDGYLDLPAKVQAVFKWALEHDYDYVLKCDDDVFVYPERLLQAFDTLDYTGFQNGDYISGACYWVSRRSMECIAQAAISDTVEDRWVGKTLKDSGILPTHNSRYQNCHCEVCKQKYGNNMISFHCWPKVSLMYELMNA